MKTLPSILLIVIGGACSTLSWNTLNLNSGDTPPNPFALKGSPYGKTVSMAMQATIDDYWHAGPDRKTSQTTEHKDDCSHCNALDHVNKAKKNVNPLHKQVKLGVRGLRLKKGETNSPFRLTEAHNNFLKTQIRDKILTALQLDPTNYANYNNYHFFITTESLNAGKKDPELAFKMARKTIKLCSQDPTNPTPWLTAASAQENIIEMMTFNRDAYSLDQFKTELINYDQILNSHSNALNVAIKSGRLNQLSKARVDEMETRVTHLHNRRRIYHELLLPKLQN